MKIKKEYNLGEGFEFTLQADENKKLKKKEHKKKHHKSHREHKNDTEVFKINGKNEEEIIEIQKVKEELEKKEK